MKFSSLVLGRFTIRVADVLRLLLPDVAVLLVSVVTLILSLKVVTVYRKDKKRRRAESGGAAIEGGGEGSEADQGDVSGECFVSTVHV